MDRICAYQWEGARTLIICDADFAHPDTGPGYLSQDIVLLGFRTMDWYRAGRLTEILSGEMPLLQRVVIVKSGVAHCKIEG